jgi:16S rRNA (guanine966-N2)-methyltransferase
MRIIAGKFKGRRLVDFKADHIRPTTDRVKESLFNILYPYIEDSRILDLFSGTGNLAIEAVSRGAQYVEAVEMNRDSLSIMKQNIELLDIKEGLKCVQRDVFKYLNHYSGEAFDLILVDPPFTQKLSHSILQIIGNSQVCKNQTRIAIESAKQETVEQTYPHLNFLDQRLFGDKKLTFFEVHKT